MDHRTSAIAVEARAPFGWLCSRRLLAIATKAAQDDRPAS
jgi:hypothetical protein